MAEFQNTINLLGDDVVARMLVTRTIEEYNDDEITKIGMYAFRKCTKLKSVNLPNLITVTNDTFSSCSALTKVDLSSPIRIEMSAFDYCKALKTVILRNETVCVLTAINAFNQTPFAAGGTGGTVYVPQALITQYQTATNWSTLYAAGTCNFVAIEGSEYE